MTRQQVLAFGTGNEDRFAGLKAGDLSLAEAQSVVRLALEVLAARHRPGKALISPQCTREFLRLRLAERPAEVFGCVFLDTRHRIRAVEELFQGTIDGAAVYPRIVVQRALALNAAAVAFFHNHPSGIAEPSDSDRRLTDRLREALGLVDVRVLDHFIVSAEGSFSFAEGGLL